MERTERVQGQKKSRKENEGGKENQSPSMASVGLCLSKSCDSFLRALASVWGARDARNGSEEGDGRDVKHK